ncbi:hypothetical protein [Rhodobacter sp. TJ_12]|uniref:hypothetical protein n=1 Tax=Rhodobacter sp. TJ_12 TaxID=2029399 RepID=UPI001CBD55C5|nr:hypothetical protein [Rhodobacter sp. TJ_12]
MQNKKNRAAPPFRATTGQGARRSATVDVPAPRYTLWAALLVAVLLSGFWLAALAMWQLIHALGLG